jgi:hypothetical protein
MVGTAIAVRKLMYAKNFELDPGRRQDDEHRDMWVFINHSAFEFHILACNILLKGRQK